MRAEPDGIDSTPGRKESAGVFLEECRAGQRPRRLDKHRIVQQIQRLQRSIGPLSPRHTGMPESPASEIYEHRVRNRPLNGDIETAAIAVLPGTLFPLRRGLRKPGQPLPRAVLAARSYRRSPDTANRSPPARNHRMSSAGNRRARACRGHQDVRRVSLFDVRAALGRLPVKLPT